MTERDRLALVDHVPLFVVGERHAQLPVAVAQRELERRPRPRQPGRDGQRAVTVAHASEPEHERLPHAARGGDVHAVGRISRHVGEIHEQAEAEVVDRLVLVADLGGHDALHGRRQRRVAGREAVVVHEVRALVLGRELVAEQVRRQHDVGLLDHLPAVDLERVVVEEERELVRRGGVEVPHLALEEPGVLGMDAALGVERHVHRLRGALPSLELLGLELDLVDERDVRFRVLRLEPAHALGGVAEVQARHEVRERVVVDDRRVLVGAGDAVDVERAVGGEEAQVLPQPCRLDEHLGADLGEEAAVVARVNVSADRVRDVRIDVVLRGARLVVRRRLLAVDRAPREHRAALAELARPGARRVEHAVAEAQEVPGDARLRVREERQQVHLDVPEVVALVAATGQPLRRDPGTLGAPRRLGDLEEIPADRLLDAWRVPRASTRTSARSQNRSRWRR
jgi:hypothetical protein